MPRYDFTCAACEADWEVECPLAAASATAPCPVCGGSGRRVFTMPKLLFKADPRDVRPVWHSHDGYSHQHAPRRGRHRHPSDDH